MAEITVDEWLAELSRIEGETEAGAYTARELLERWNESHGTQHSLPWMRERIRRALKARTVEQTTVRRTGYSIDGRPVVAPAYRPVRKEA